MSQVGCSDAIASEVRGDMPHPSPQCFARKWRGLVAGTGMPLLLCAQNMYVLAPVSHHMTHWLPA